MKKLITILILGAAAMLRADDTTDMLSLVEHIDAVKQMDAAATEGNRYVGLRLYQMESKTGFMRTRFAECNTFLWYIWNDYEAARGFEKLEFGKSIERLSH